MGETTAVEHGLYPPERQEAILRLARANGRVEVASLAESFQITTETVRRDLSALQQRRLIRRVHGGAILWEGDEFEPLVAQRDTRNVEQKRRIAIAAIEELPPDGTVLLDSGSTTARVAQFLPPGHELTVFTNSMLNVQVLATNEDVELIVLGGAFDKNTLTMVDEQTTYEVQRLKVDTVIVGTDGLSPEGGLTTPHRHQAGLKRAMIAAGRHVVALADSSKIPRDHLIRFATCNEIDTLITDTGVDEGIVTRLESAGLNVVRA